MSRSFGRSPITKIYVDSRFKTRESTADTNFSVDLPEMVELGEGVGCLITDITIPHTWYNINQTNNRLYFRIVRQGMLVAVQDGAIAITPQNYNIIDLAQQIQDTLNEYVQFATFFTVTAYPELGTIEFDVTVANTAVEILDDTTLQGREGGTWAGPVYDTNNLRSMNGVLRMNGRVRQSRIISPSTAVETGVVDLLPFHSLYITSTKLSNYTSLSVNGQRNVLKKVLVSSGYGDINYYDYIFPEEASDVSGLSLKLIDFQIRDGYGNVIDLNGAHVTFTIVFIKL